MKGLRPRNLIDVFHHVGESRGSHGGLIDQLLISLEAVFLQRELENKLHCRTIIVAR